MSTDEHPSSGEFEKSKNLQMLAKFRDRESWERFVGLYTPLIGYWIRNRGIKTHDVDNLRQEVFARLMVSLERFSSQTASGSFRSWLRTITNNIVTDYFRRKGVADAFGGSEALQIMHQIPGQESSLGNMFDSISSENQNENAILFRQIMEWVEKNVSKTKADVFRMVVMEDRSPTETAEKFGIRSANVYQIKSRILAKIRAEFGDLL